MGPGRGSVLLIMLVLESGAVSRPATARQKGMKQIDRMPGG